MSKPVEEPYAQWSSKGETFECKCCNCLLQVKAFYDYPEEKENWSEVYIHTWQLGPSGGVWSVVRHAFSVFWTILRRGDMNGYEVCLGPVKAKAVAVALMREAYFAEHGKYLEDD